MQADLTEPLQEKVLDAIQNQHKLRLTGSGSKAFYGRQAEGLPLDITGHRGIVQYEPTELVLTARAGTPLIEIEQTLAEQQQMLAFEPPHFGPRATLGGTIACGHAVQAVSGMSSLVARMAGIRLPIRSYPLQAMVTQPVKPFLDPLVSSAALRTS